MNRRIQVLFAILTCTVFAASATTASASGVTVGQSSLIGNLDYSDTFTETANGGIPGRIDNAYPVNSPGIAVENTYGHPAQNWTNGEWSINQDNTVVSGGPYPIYPGGSGAGSVTGLTQTGGNETDYGLSYGVRHNYVVQFDAVQTGDRIDITSSGTRDTIFGSNTLSVFFRATNGPGGLPQIGLYNGTTETGVTGLSSGIAAIDTWNNYAVDFDQTDNLLKIYTNQNLLTTLNLATFAGGIYENYSNSFVNVGGAGSSVLWTDNFEVGSAIVPEPSSLVSLAGIGMLGLIGFAVRRKSCRTSQG